jgi:signal transduction histidine kinase
MSQSSSSPRRSPAELLLAVEALEKELASERAGRREAETAQQRLTFLYQATATLMSTELGPKATMTKLAQLSVPDLADWCVVDLIDAEAAAPVRIAVTHLDPVHAALAASIMARPIVGDDASLGVGHVLATGEPELVTELPRSMTEQSTTPHLALLRDVAARSYMIAPLAVAGSVVGAVTFLAAESGRRYGPADLALAVDLCARASLLVSMANLLDAERGARAAAESAILTRDDLLAVVTHDLRNPLTTIVSGASVVETLGGGDQRVARAAELIQRAARQMARLISDLLDLARIQTGKLVIERRTCEVEAILADAVEILTPLAAAKQQTLFAESLSLAQIPCDRERVIQVLSNLVGNAVKFTPAGQQISLRAAPDPGGVKFCVSDGGPGIPAADLPHVFDRYWQAKKTARLGIGLGLSIAKGIVDAHGGRIWAESELGLGSTFFFTLPAEGEAWQSGAAASPPRRAPPPIRPCATGPSRFR